MNPWQMAQQIKEELETTIWVVAGVNGEAVFGRRSVFVSAVAPSDQQIPPGFPWSLVQMGEGTHDEDDPELIEQGYEIVIGVEVAGDPNGEFALIGSSIANRGKSMGKGILEVSERARNAVQDLTGADGARIMVTATSTGGVTPLASGRHVAVSVLTVKAICTSQPHYPAPQELAEASDVWTWEGSHCSDRFDFVQYKLLRKTGAIPQDVTSDTLVYTGTAATTSIAPVSGETYAIFCEYDDNRGSGNTASINQPNEVGAFLAK